MSGVTSEVSPDVERGSIVLVVVSPRVPASVMTREAWTCLERADRILARNLEEPLPLAVDESGLTVCAVSDADSSARALASALVEQAAGGLRVAWLGSSDADPGLTDALAEVLTAQDDPPPVEVVVGSWDEPGARLLDAVAVMDTLRSPGGCPWDAQQTHASLAPYLVEEAFEVTEAIAEKDSAHLEEELGDVLLQVLFHARVASDRGADGFDIDGVAGRLVDKLVRRHPHVFAGEEASGPEQVEARWAQIKADERAAAGTSATSGPFDTIPSGMPPLERAVKMVARASKAGLDQAVADVADADGLGPALLDLVVQARALGTDPGVALATTLARLETTVGAGNTPST